MGFLRKLIPWGTMVSEKPDAAQEARLRQLEQLFWLADAPLFIDDRLVGKFFDAVVRPKYEHISQTEERSRDEETALNAAFGLKGATGIKLPEWLKPIKLDVKANANLKGGRKQAHHTGSVSEFRPIWNAERQLEELTKHYLVHHRERLLVGDRPLDDPQWPGDQTLYSAPEEFFEQFPRAIVFLDLPRGTRIIPTAAEFNDSTIALLYEDLATRLTGPEGGPLLKYEETGSREQRNHYWASYWKYFRSKDAMLTIEKASKDHDRIKWIDFRLLRNDTGESLHLHVVPGGNADAGIFGYNFVRRADRHGIRMVGTLKLQPDMNVFAIYEK